MFDRNWFKQFDGETVTLSISVDGVVYSGSSMMFTYNEQYDTNNFITIPFNVDIYSSNATTNPYLRIFGNTGGKHVEWVKLEVGNKATPYIPPNPFLELLKCMRYYQTSASLNGSMNSNCPITKAAMNGSKLSAVELAVPMRITPTINIFSAVNGNSNTVNEWTSDSPVSNIVTYYANEKRFKSVVIEHKDYDDLIKVYDRPTAFFYLDPPYYGTEDMYDVIFTKEDHLKLKQHLSNIKGLFLLSYNDDPFIRELYKDFNIEAVERNNNMTTGSYKELLIRNY